VIPATQGAGASRGIRNEHRLPPASAPPADDPGGLAGALPPGSPPVGVVSAALSPVLLTGGYLLAGALQPASYNPVRETISAMAGQAGTDRWAMTGGIGLAGIGIAASPEPASGATPRHLAWTVLGAVTTAVWPALAARRTSDEFREPQAWVTTGQKYRGRLLPGISRLPQREARGARGPFGTRSRWIRPQSQS
jgi:hypothetical protein